MTKDEVIRMAREAGLKVGENISGFTLIGSPLPMGLAHIDLDEMQRFAALVEAPLEKRIQDLYSQIEVLEKQLDDQYKMGMEAEREACAKVCEDIATKTYGMTKLREYGECAAAIRARGEK